MITIDKDAAATPSTEVEVSPDQQAQQQGLPSDDVSITSQDRVSLAGDQVYSPDFLDRNFSGRETLGAEVERQRVYRTFSAIDEVRRIATENGLAPHELKLSGEETLPSALRLQLERAIETKIEEGRALIAERQGIDIDQVKYSLPPRVAAELLGRMKPVSYTHLRAHET